MKGSFLKDCGFSTNFFKGWLERKCETPAGCVGEVRLMQEFTPRRAKSVGGLPIDVQTGGASTKTKGITMSRMANR